MYYTLLESPIGALTVSSRSAEDDASLTGLFFSTGSKARGADPSWTHRPAAFRRVARQIGEYFEGRRSSFELQLDPPGTDFQRSVLDALLTIPFGETRSYRDIAEQIGNPKAVRAVGAANGSNPIALVIPCHRVIGSNGSLTGFGGGLDAKRFLLEHEVRHSGLFA